jgi:hypothetical protein
MSEKDFLDIAHIFFLESIADAIKTRGAAAATGELARRAKAVSEKISVKDFGSAEDLINALDTGNTALTRLEGRAKHYGNNVFTLPDCPFGESIARYIKEFKELPTEFKELADEFNKLYPQNRELKVGGGAGASAFCSVHQPLRSFVSRRMTVQGKPIKMYQLGCKSSSGVKAFAEEYIKESQIDKSVVDKALDDNSCVYWLQIQ